MFNRLTRWLLGYAEVLLDAAVKDLLLDQLISVHAPLWGLRQDSAGNAVLFLPRRLAHAFAQTSGVRVLAWHGLPRLLARYRRRYGLAVGALLIAAVWTLGSGVIWEVRITGLERIDEREVRDALAEQGVGVGKPFGRLDLWQVQNAYLIEDERLEWISINRRGTVMLVQLKEQRYEEPDDAQKAGCVSVLAADAEGVIVRVESTAGDVLVQPGDVVGRGQTLISGLEPDAEGVYRLVRAGGKVYAQTVYRIRIEIPLEQVQKQYTGEIYRERGLIFFGKNIKLFSNYGNLPALCDKIEDEKSYILPGGSVLPLQISTDHYLPYEEKTVRLTQEQALAQAEAALQEEMRSALADAEIESTAVQEEWSEDLLVVHGAVECVRNIAREDFVTFTPSEEQQNAGTDGTD